MKQWKFDDAGVHEGRRLIGAIQKARRDGYIPNWKAGAIADWNVSTMPNKDAETGENQERMRRRPIRPTCCGLS
jgi:hypothetical protein